MRFTRRKWLFSFCLFAAGALLVAGAWHVLFARDRPTRFVGTWKLESPAGRERMLRYRFDADGRMRTSVGDTHTESEWFVDDGELVLITDSDSPSLGRFLRDLVTQITDSRSDPDAIRFAVEGTAKRMKLTPTRVSGIQPVERSFDIFIRVDEPDSAGE